MTVVTEGHLVDGVPVVRLESGDLRVDVAPSVGGRVVSLVHRETGHEFLWRNRHLALERCPSASEYDAHFYGGIDELIPNDPPEIINGVSSPDHGELWTTALTPAIVGDRLVLSGRLPRCGLVYQREMRLRADGPWLDLRYRIVNGTDKRRVFGWKLHAALRAEPGDRLECPARKARVVDPEWSRWKDEDPFGWSDGRGKEFEIPPFEGTCDFLTLYELPFGEMVWRSSTRDLVFAYFFDPDVFRTCWYFASYGGFFGHYTAILEPCTTTRLLVSEAAALGECSSLAPGETLDTRVMIYAGQV